jgi:hypothetical protein
MDADRAILLQGTKIRPVGDFSHPSGPLLRVRFRQVPRAAGAPSSSEQLPEESAFATQTAT